jgi:enterochelin esterase family protein
MHGRVERLRLQGRCLEGNPLGDPHERDVYVYVPPTREAGDRFPSILLLPGYGSNHLSILSYSPWTKNTVERFDEQVAAGETPPAILVLPDCMTRWGGSQFIDSPGLGRYQSYLVEDVLPAVDAHFPTVPEACARAAAGRSSGGFGALRLALDRPGVVSAIASHAGDAAFEVSMRPMFTSAAIGFELAGGLAAFAERLPKGGPRNGPEFDAAFVLASSAAYSPDPSGPFPHVSLPFDPADATLDAEAFARWSAHDPVTRAGTPDGAAALRQLALVFLDAGNRDEHGLHFAARALAERCRAAGVKVHFEEFDGGHRGTSHRYELSLPMLARALHAQLPSA